MSSSDVPGRRNGFSSPFSKPQILAWFVLLATALQFVFFVSPILPIAVSVPITIVFYMLIGSIVYYGGLTQAIDPIDVHLRKYLIDTQPDVENKLSKFYMRINPMPKSDDSTPIVDNVDEPMKQCWLCDTQVAEPSMHCKFCNKCVKNFDHHCTWLNTCIGRDNYQYFFRTMVCIFVMQLYHIGIQIYLVVDIHRGGATATYANQWFNANAALAVEIVLICFIVFDGISVFLIGQLLYFHMMLQRKKLTTYSYIVQESNNRREKMRVMEEIQSKRVAQITRAKQEGRCIADVWKLELGRFCRGIGCTSCDPIKAPSEINSSKKNKKNSESTTASNINNNNNNNNPPTGDFALSLSPPNNEQSGNGPDTAASSLSVTTPPTTAEAAAKDKSVPTTNKPVSSNSYGNGDTSSSQQRMMNGGGSGGGSSSLSTTHRSSRATSLGVGTASASAVAAENHQRHSNNNGNESSTVTVEDEESGTTTTTTAAGVNNNGVTFVPVGNNKTTTESTAAVPATDNKGVKAKEEKTPIPTTRTTTTPGDDDK